MTARSGGDPQSSRRWAVAVGLVAGLAVALLGGSVAGAADVGASDVLHVIGLKLGLADGERFSDSVLWAVRFPRLLAGALAGALFGLSGATLQGVLRNEMADPQFVGVLPAAGLGAIAGIAVTPAGGSAFAMMTGAALAGAVAALLIRRVARRVPRGSQFILVGLVIGLTCLAWLGAIVVAWDSPRVPTFTFWVFGGLTGATWSTLGAALLPAAAGSFLVLRGAKSLDLIALGETEARHLGVDVDRVAGLALVGAGFAAGAAVGLAGVVGFVGLVVPLVLRSTVGPAHRWLLPLSALGGAVAVVAVDIAARTVAAPVEIPVGLLTAALGGPVFVAALVRFRRWAP